MTPLLREEKQFQRALAEIERALQIDPDDKVVVTIVDPKKFLRFDHSRTVDQTVDCSVAGRRLPTKSLAVGFHADVTSNSGDVRGAMKRYLDRGADLVGNTVVHGNIGYNDFRAVLSEQLSCCVTDATQ